MKSRTLRLCVVAFLLVSVSILMGTRGYKKTSSGGSSGAGGIAGLAKTCRYIENPANGEDFEALFGHFFTEVTAIAVWCRTEGGTDVDLHLYEQNGTGKVTFTTGTDIVCDNDSDAGFDDNFTDEIIQAGNEIGLVITDVDGSVTTVNICIEFE